MNEARVIETQRAQRRSMQLTQAATDERARPVWFGSARQELFALYHAPAAPSCGMGIVLCNPFGYEAMCTHRAYLHLAQRLSQRGFAVLRFDYHGTGDSSGNDLDPERWQAWSRSVQTAIDELRVLSGCEQFGLVGCRLGANLALIAAAQRHDVRAIAAWGPAYCGRAFLREELAVHKLRAQPTHGPALTDSDAAAQTEALGFVLSAATLAELGAHQLADLRELRARSVLLLGRDTANQDPRIADKLQRLGIEVTLESGSGYAAMVQDNITPDATWDMVVGYFESQAAAAPLGRVHVRRHATSASANVWDALDSPDAVRETACYFGPGGHLFGVLTEGNPARHSAGEPAVLLLSGGVNHHVGQNRMYTRWARAWAAAGITTLRFDLAGFGDSGQSARGGEGELHSLDAVADVQAAMEHMAQRVGSQRFIMIGLCSGAFTAFHTALQDPRIVGLGLLNWTHFYSAQERPESVAGRNLQHAERSPTDRRYHALRYYVQRFGTRSTWQRALRGELDVAGIARHLATRLMGRLRSELAYGYAAMSGKKPAATQLAKDFEQLAARDVSTCIIYNGDEPVIDVLVEQLGPQLRRWTRSGQLRLELLDGADHVFTPVRSQAQVFGLLTRLLLQP